MAEDKPAESAEKPVKPEKSDKPEKTGAPKASGWAVYKPGQGYWTRMCTAGAVGIVVGLLCYWIYSSVMLAPFLDVQKRNVRMGVSAAIFLMSALFLWRYMNRPKIADFLIDTELEMAKVNWTSPKELFGSTRVVIFFVVLVSLVLFVFDLFFIKLFVTIGVLSV